MKIYEVVSIITYTLSKFFPKKKNRWIFGSWFGTAVSDNPKALFDYMQKYNPNIEKIWITNCPTEYQKLGCKVIKRNSLKSLKYILTAQVAVMNQGFGDFSAFNFLGGCYKVQLWHGIAWKKIVKDAYPQMTKFQLMIFQYINQYDLYIAPSLGYKKILINAFGAKDTQVLLGGQPRNEVLFDHEYCWDCKNLILNKIGQENKKIIVYMPTFRDKTSELFSFCNSMVASELLNLRGKDDFVIIEKMHYAAKKDIIKEEGTNIVYSLPNERAEVLLAAADILITDYSSCFFDYLIRNKPIVHFAYDYDYYKNKDRGLYYNIEDVAAGSIVYSEEKLAVAIAENLKNPDLEIKRRKIVREKYVTYENKNNCSIIIQHILKELNN